ncbi:MAG TPA: DUF6266 family protein [Lentimicrobium sp.]|nr:DUF6266 family protein [Lentimicrobium sp.]
MARSKTGLFGLFIGKIGTIIFSIWKGKQISRTVAAHIHNPNSPAQKRERTKFSIMTKFISENHDLFNLGYTLFSKQMHTANAAYKFNHKTVVAGTYPNQYIDVTQLNPSSGKLLPLDEFTASSDAIRELTLSWQNNSFMDTKASGSDNLIVAVFDEGTASSQTFMLAGKRGDESATIKLDKYWKAEKASVYAFLIKADITKIRKPVHISNSVKATGVTVQL